MESAIPQGELAEIVREARSRTGVPAVAAGLSVAGVVELAAAGPVDVETPFRVASITKWFTASLATLVLDLEENEEVCRLLSHTADLRPSGREPLPDACRGLWSYSNAGYVLAGRACADAAGMSFSDAMRERVLEPLALAATSFEEPTGAADGHFQEGEAGQRPAGPVEYPESRRAAGGLWSTVGDLLRFASHQIEEGQALRRPQARALGADYCLGCWRRELEGGRVAYDHDGSVGGFQSLLLVVPKEELALVVLTNSWRGSGLIRRIVQALGLIPASNRLLQGSPGPIEPGRYALGDAEAVVERRGAGDWRIAGAETDPLAGARIERPLAPVTPVGDGVYGFAGGLLMGHRVDFPRPGVARVGWVALPRVGA
jgi:CubicO group peptidase (beta-lactamase class C family)